MKTWKLKLSHMFLLVLTAAIALACFVEQKSVVGESTTSSPDKNWRLNLKLVEHSTLIYSRRTLDTHLAHSTKSGWDVKTSIPFDDANAEMIGNKDPDHPVVWSDDSVTVSYWINEGLEDWMKIEANSRQHKFQRKLSSLTAIQSSPGGGG